MVDPPLPSPSRAPIEMPRARDRVINAAIEGCRAPDSSRERWAMESSARTASCSSVRPERTRSSRRFRAMDVRTASSSMHRL